MTNRYNFLCNITIELYQVSFGQLSPIFKDLVQLTSSCHRYAFYTKFIFFLNFTFVTNSSLLKIICLSKLVKINLLKIKQNLFFLSIVKPKIMRI